jgi:hypothetical protein
MTQYALLTDTSKEVMFRYRSNNAVMIALLNGRGVQV